MRTFLYTLFLTSISSITYAYPTSDSIGFGLGYTWTQAVFNDEIRILGTTQEVPSYTSVDNDQLPWRLYYAVRYHENYGIELGIINFGSIQFKKTLTTQDSSTNSITSTSVRNANIESQGYYLQHILEYPLSKSLQTFLKVGIIIGDTNYAERETLTVFSEDTGTSTVLQLNNSSENFIDLHLAAGMNYFINDSCSLILQINQVKIDHKEEKEMFTQWLTTTSLAYHF